LWGGDAVGINRASAVRTGLFIGRLRVLPVCGELYASS
jgi:hypothetical protein